MNVRYTERLLMCCRVVLDEMTLSYQLELNGTTRTSLTRGVGESIQMAKFE